MAISPMRTGILLLIVTFGPGLAGATSVRSVTVGEMIEGSQVIFEGRVVAVEARGGSLPGTIRTCVLFEVIDLIKGEISGNTLELCFSGGALGERTRWVSGMNYPEPGESGIYFVEDAKRPLVNPVFGWDQGRFPIQVLPSGTEPRVTVAGGGAVVGLGRGDSATRAGLSRGVAIGVEVDSGDTEDDPATSAARSRPPDSSVAGAREEPRAPLSSESFKAIVRALIEDPAP